jgi:transmembrane sensor
VSGESGKLDAQVGAMDVEAKAAAWLREKHFEDWNAARQAAFEAWLSESSAHRVAAIRLEAAWSKTERINALYRSAQGASSVGERRWPRWGAVSGAAAAVVAVIAFGFGNRVQPAEKVFSTAVGGHETISFADGSEIDLNTDTVLRARVSQSSRLVFLDKGEAYFRIKHDAAHPFVAIVAGHRITDLGTKFLIRNEPERLEVALVEGRARFDAADRKVRPISVELLPGDVVVSRNGEMTLRHKAAPAMARELGWRRGVVVFDNTALIDAAAEFNRYSKTRLLIAGNAGALKINGTFQLNNLEAFAETAQDALGLKLTHQANQIVISH